MRFSFDNTVSKLLGRLSGTFKEIEKEVVKRKRKISFKDIFYAETVSIACQMGRRGIASVLENFKKLAVSPQAIGKFSKKTEISHFNKIVKSLQSYFPKARRIIAVDGSALCLSKFIGLNERLFKLTPSGSYTTASLTCLFDCINQIPIAFNLRQTGDERKGFLALIDYLKKGDVVVFDKGYFSKDLVKILKSKKINFVFRLKSNSKLIKRRKGFDTKVILEKFNLRLITYRAGDNDFFLLTNLSYRDNWESIAEIYRQRWTIETWYKILKIDLGGYFYSFKKLQTIEHRIYWQIITSIMISIIAYESSKKMKKRKDNYQIGKKYLLNHAIEVFGYFAYPSKRNQFPLEQKFFIFGRTCLTLVIRFRKFPYKSIIDKGKWYKGKGKGKKKSKKAGKDKCKEK